MRHFKPPALSLLCPSLYPSITVPPTPYSLLPFPPPPSLPTPLILLPFLPPPFLHPYPPPTHTGTLYGIAHSTMAIGSGGGIVGCEGVTLLPPGSRWLSLALACLQVDTREIDQDFDEDDVLAGKSTKKFVISLLRCLLYVICSLLFCSHIFLLPFI